MFVLYIVVLCCLNNVKYFILGSRFQCFEVILNCGSLFCFITLACLKKKKMFKVSNFKVLERKAKE